MHEERGEIRHDRGYRMHYLLTLPEERRDDTLHVFLHGYSRIESQSPPVFYRRKWAPALGAACLFLSDPVHVQVRGSACGWYLLGFEQFQERILQLRDEIIDRHALNGTVWHGPSSGGYAAARLCVASPTPDLAFVVAAHNDPASVHQWHEESPRFADLDGVAPATPLTDLRAEWPKVPGRFLYYVISEQDEVFAHKQLRPILASYQGQANVRSVLLRNGLGHGAISDPDYEAQLESACRQWREWNTAAVARTTGSGER